jgi:ferritin
MLSTNLQTAFNDQINKELYSAYLYLGMSAWCENANLPGAGHWLKAQAAEEQGHALKFYGCHCQATAGVHLSSRPLRTGVGARAEGYGLDQWVVQGCSRRE